MFAPPAIIDPSPETRTRLLPLPPIETSPSSCVQ
jgi:hypothetical protein